jgi:chromosome segregation ATPase
MSNSQNGKNGKEKEIDRLLKLIDSIGRIDEKLDALHEQYNIDCADNKERMNTLQAQVNDLEKRRSDLVQQVEDTKNKINKLEEGIARWKIYWAAIAFIASPILTTVIIFLITHFLNGMPW